MTTRVAVLLGDPGRPNSVMPDRPFGDDHLCAVAELHKALEVLPGYSFEYLTAHETLLDDLRVRRGSVDLVFNLCDEGYRNRPDRELHIPALLDLLELPYTGAGPACLALCFDKSIVRHIARDLGVPVAGGRIYAGSGDYPFPAIVKPARADGSWGITQRSVVANLAELHAAVFHLRGDFQYHGEILVEEFLPGMDFTAGIIGNRGSYHVLPPLEDSYADLPPGLPRLCGYEAKWLPASPYWKIKPVPAALLPEQQRLVSDASIAMAERLECRDYVRCDWRLDAAGNPRLLEVNPNPGWGWEGDGHFAKMARLAGIGYPEMLAAILCAARRRYGI
jgi:D-alanine-D-alanine ligase